MSSPRHIIHVDMDAFYASVEQLDHPEYRGKPVIVGADPRNGLGRGVVSAASYEARRFGIHSALPISVAFKRCPQGIFCLPRMNRYLEISKRIQSLFESFTPVVEPISLDEAFLDVTGTERLWGEVEKIGRIIKNQIKKQEGLIASVGIGPNKLIAKIASDFDKPDGFVIVPSDSVQEFLNPIPVKCLWGVGKKTQEILAQMGIHLIGDLSRLSRETLIQRFGRLGESLWFFAHGIDHGPVISSRGVKSVSNETTFAQDVGDIQVLLHTVQALADKVGYRLRRKNISGRTVTLKIRFEGFDTYVRHVTRENPVCLGSDIRDNALDLLSQFDLENQKVRLIGVGVTQLVSGCESQGDLFDENLNKKINMARATDILRNKFGHRIIGNAESFRKIKN